MWNSKKLERLKNRSKIISFDENDKIVFFSDCHRGDGTIKDSLYPNRNIYVMALRYYLKNGYTCIEVGDGDELWKFKHINDIFEAHSDEYQILNEFKKRKKFYMIYGNHDDIKSKANFKKEILKYKDKNKRMYDFYNDLPIYEGLIVKFNSSRSYFVFHGHQIDFINNEFAGVSKFLVRHIWGFLNGAMSFNEITSPARCKNTREWIDRFLANWSKENNQAIIIGHTHKTMCPDKSEPQYFNIGAAVLPYTVTCIEVRNGTISLMKWIVEAVDGGLLAVRKEFIGMPREY